MNQDLVNVVESLHGTVLFNGAIVQFTDTTFMDALKKIYESGVLAERERILDICKEGLWDAEGIRYHLDTQARGQA